MSYEGWLPVVAFVLAIVALVSSVFLLVTSSGKVSLSGSFEENLATELPSELRDEIERLREMVSRLPKPGPVTAVRRSDRDPRTQRFVDLTMAWQRETGRELRGAAVEDLASAGRGGTGSPAAAERLVEYLVLASEGRKPSLQNDRIEQILVQLTGLVKMEMIQPRQGQRYDATRHAVVSTVSAGGNQRGTIAEVVARGLDRGSGGVLKAKVLLYD